MLVLTYEAHDEHSHTYVEVVVYIASHVCKQPR